MSMALEDFSHAAVCCRRFPQLTCSSALEAQHPGFPQCTADALFDLTRILGVGATSVVYLAKRLSPSGSDQSSPPASPVPSRRYEESSLVAVKVVNLEGRDDAERKRCFAEVECLSMCSCFSVLRDHCDFSYPPDTTNLRKIQTLLLILDYASSGDLRREVKVRRANQLSYFSEQQVSLILLQLVMALKYVHEHGILHRDIKSANIFLCSNGLVKLGDFGMSHIFATPPPGEEQRPPQPFHAVAADSAPTSPTASSLQPQAPPTTKLSDVFCGSPFYVSPEMWLRQPYDYQSDLYSLGVVLFEMLALRRPFEQATLEELRSAVVTSSIPESEWASIERRYPSLTPLAKGLLRVDPQDRMTVDSILASPVMRWSTSTLLQIAYAPDVIDLAPADRDRIVRGVRRLAFSVASNHRKTRQEHRITKKSLGQLTTLSSGRCASTASNMSGNGMLGTATGTSFLFSAASSSTTSPARRPGGSAQTVAFVPSHAFAESPTTSAIASPFYNAPIDGMGVAWDTVAQNTTAPRVTVSVVHGGTVWKDQAGDDLKLRYLTLTSIETHHTTLDSDVDEDDGDPLGLAPSTQFSISISHTATDERVTQRSLQDFEDVFRAPLSALAGRSDEAKKWGFVLILRDGKRHLFRCDTEGECDAWVTHLENAMTAQPS